MKKRVFFLLLAAVIMPFALHAQQNASAYIVTSDTGCVNYTWNVNDSVYSVSGAYTCYKNDTLFVLDLTIGQTYSMTDNTPISGGCTFEWGDSVFTTSGYHTYTFASMLGCDSTVTINLQLTTSASKNYTVTACESYTWKGQPYTESGIYNITDTSNVLCDSILSLDLTVLTPTQKQRDTVITACAYYLLNFIGKLIECYDDTTVTTNDNGYSYSAARINTFHPRTAERCFDSVSIVNVVINDSSFSNFTAQACEEYSFTVGSTEHVYYFSVVDSIRAPKNVMGCDSVVVLNLTINRNPEVVIGGDLRVTPGSTAVINVTSDQNNMSYLWDDNSTDAVRNLGTVDGNVDVWVIGTNDNTGCSNITYATVMANASLNEASSAQVSVYPNPASSFINISSTDEIANVSLFNNIGQKVLDAGNTTMVDMSSLTNGIYVVRVELKNGAVTTNSIVLSK